MMYCCKCLNVTINTSKIEKIDHHSLMLSDAERIDQFFKQDFLKVTLDSIQKVQECLVHVRTVGEWLVHQCWNCGTYTHAIRTDKSASSALISSSLIVNADDIAILRKSNQYSAAFRIVIYHSDSDMEPEKVSELISVKRKIEAGDLALGGLRQQLNELIKLETEATEDRVKKYAEQQYSQLDLFKERVRRDHRVLMRNVLVNQASCNVANCNTDNIERLETPPSNVDMYYIGSTPITIGDSENNRQALIKPRHNQVTNLGTQPKITSSPRKTNSKLSNSMRGETYDSETLFDLEGMDDNPSLNRTQSDVESDTDDSQDHEEIVAARPRPMYSSSLAKSLPINVPAFMSAYHHNGVDIDDDQAPEYPLDIAASIKALAKSVHGDAVFGDLPRPRFSTQI